MPHVCYYNIVFSLSLYLLEKLTIQPSCYLRLLGNAGGDKRETSKELLERDRVSGVTRNKPAISETEWEESSFFFILVFG